MGDFKDAVSSGSLGVDDTLPANVKVSGSSGDRRFRRTAERALSRFAHPTYGMRSRSKCESRSIKWKSWRRSGPFGPAR